MKNLIFYGKPGIGKSRSLYDLIGSFSGQVFLLDPSATDESLQLQFNDARVMKLSDLANDQVLGSAEDEKIVIYKDQPKTIPIKSISNLMEYVSHLGKEKKTLIAIDHLEDMNLEFTLGNGKSALLNLLELSQCHPNISIILVVRDLSFFKSKYRSEYNMIFSMTEFHCPNYIENFSGDLRIRFAKDIHKNLVEKAIVQGVSLNSYINFLLTKGMFESKDLPLDDLSRLIEERGTSMSEVIRLIDRFTSINKDFGLSVDLFFDHYVKEPKRAYDTEE